MRLPFSSPIPLVVAAVLLASSPAAAQRATSYPLTDAYGYLVWDQSSAVCPSAVIDISSGASPIVFTPAATDPALDEGGAVIILAAPFELYGRPITDLVVSSNGYLAAAASLAGESGGDFSNDCPLPAIAEEGPASQLRIAVLHDDLDGASVAGPGGDGTASYRFFATCPRPSGVIAGEACTVVQWTDWHVLGSTTAFDIQAVLYHQSFAIAVQYAGGAYTARPTSVDRYGATVGIQDASASTGLTALCNARSLPMDGAAFCFFEPRFPPPTGDLWVELADKTDFPAPGGQLEYFLRVVNPGPGPVTGAAVTVTPAPELTACTWTCAATPGSSCTPIGSGPPISDTVTLAAAGAADYELLCDLDPAAAGGTVITSTSLAVPSGYADPDLANNTDSATTDIPIPVTLQTFTIE